MLTLAQYLDLLVNIAWLAFLASVATKVVNKIMSNDRIELLRDMMGIGSPGPMEEHEYWQMKRWVEDRRDK